VLPILSFLRLRASTSSLLQGQIQLPVGPQVRVLAEEKNFLHRRGVRVNGSSHP
jgi:hypothetical protein